METRYRPRTFVAEALLIVIAIIYLVPFYFVLLNSFKTLGEIMVDTAAWPQAFTLKNFSASWEAIDFPKVLLNSVLVTSLSVTGMVIIGAMAAWRLVRFPGKVSTVLFIMFISAMVIPFQSIMIPLVQLTKNIGLINSIPGLIVIYFGFGVSFTIFLFHGFVKSVPLEVEEAAIVDGCGDQRLFWSIVLPLLKPMIVTALILNSLWIWNDFLLPLLMLQDRELRTIPIALYSFFAQYSKKWDLAMATLTMSAAPIILLFLSLQKYIIKGIAAGSVKG
ncbi:Inner membrane ABC transporter permease protein ycjP [Chlamydia abortus]|uniref:carbohydrate ABC transporter permease n=1 Tax=unclassified Paenibacillus TaxID=185978 RepID=UPI000A27B89C|nr:carbohydrate ABC transporter permease [Paenibacillus sp. 32O-W]SHE14192.1 Inner membrane ABC transporter permease protein ycjP [Chlamydia abortus]